MIPLRDENPTKTFPFITTALIAINLLVFLYEVNLGSQFEKKIFLFGAVPFKITHLANPLILVTLLTSLFFHGDFFHLAGNMLYLWVFGNNIEDKLGHLKFVYFYFICGILATLGYMIVIPDSKLPLIGASGAISGVLGAYFLLYPDAKILVLIPFFIFWRILKVSAFWFLLFWILLQFFYGTTTFSLAQKQEAGGIAWFAHIFGFIVGALLLTLWKNKSSQD